MNAKLLFSKDGALREFLLPTLILLTLMIAATFASSQDASQVAVADDILVHNATITISPDTANCGELGNNFVVNIENDITSPDNISEVRIYNGTVGVDNFVCGPAPLGWERLPPSITLPFGYCEYKENNSDSIDSKIHAGQSLDFTADALISSKGCFSEFLISTLDDKRPIGEHEFNTVQVNIDCSPPIIEKTVGDPSILIDENCNPNIEICDYWVTQSTPIGIFASDDNQSGTNTSRCDHGLDHCEWTVSVDGEEVDSDTEENGDDLNFGIPISEDSEHTISVTCVDKAGNENTIEELDIVESVPPNTTKRFIGPSHIHNANNSGPEVPGHSFGGPGHPGQEWIDSVTTIELNVTDPAPHPSGIDKTWYANLLATSELPCRQPENYCNGKWNDILSSPYSDSETADCIESVQQSCLVNGTHGSLAWTNCVENAVHKECGVNERWKLYNGTPLANISSSCHILQFFSVDMLGNAEDMNFNCYFVDKQRPEIRKNITEGPKFGNCPPKPESDDECFINSSTKIELYCNDSAPHPSEHETIWYRYRVAEELNISGGPDWGDWLPGGECDGPSLPDGWCDHGGTKKNVTFPESSLHEMEWYCEDAVGKRSDGDVELFKVDNEPPVITKEMFGNWLGDCPPQDADDICYVEGNFGSGVTVWAIDPFSIHASDNVSCRYTVLWNNSGEWEQVDGGEFASGTPDIYQDIVFKEDSAHQLIVSCSDAVGNTVEDIETFLVDSTPPETEKVYGTPMFTQLDWCTEVCEYEEGQDGDEHQGCIHECLEKANGGQDIGGHWYPVWINSSTLITLSATDNKVGVDNISWRNTLVDDEFCRNAELCEEEAEGEGDFVEYEGPFNKPEQSCHLIEYYAVDKLGNEEELKKQCAFVDNAPPVGVKEVGRPAIDMCAADDQVAPESNVVSQFSIAALGDVVHQLDASTFLNPGYTNHCSVGLAFDGSSLYYNRCGDENMYKIHPVTGALEDTFDTNVELKPNAMAYDATRNGIWFGTQACSGSSPRKMPIYLWDLDDDSVTLMFEVPETLINPATGADFLGFCFLDGLTFNANGPGAADDELWFSDDINPNLGVFKTDGTFVAGYDATDTHAGLSTLSGLAIGGPNLYMGNNGGGKVFRADKDTLAFVDLFASEDERLEDMECDPITFNNEANGFKEVMWVRHTPQSVAADDLITAFEIEPKSCREGGRSFCGDGDLDPGEQCDDGNNANGDGCSAVCKIEKVEEDCELDWIVNQSTPVWLSCDDQQPHPVDHASLFFKVSYENPPFLTEDYCENIGGVMVDGWCKAESPLHFNFTEDSMHDLEYYCVDALGNANEADLEWFAVESVPPITTKSFIGPLYIKEVCTGEEEERECHDQEYIDTVSQIVLNATDPAPHPSGVNATYWRNQLVPNQYCADPERYCRPCVGYSIDNGQGCNPDLEYNVYTGPFNRSEASCHMLEFYSVDNLGQQETVKTNCFFVDHTPPVTVKRFQGPQFPQDDDHAGSAHWISTITNVTLSAYDPEPHPSGVNSTYWRNSLVDDTFCADPELCPQAQGSGNWNLYTGPFHKNEQSCHLIEYFSVDNVNKTEQVKKQCVFVDNSAPTPNKTVGEPKSKILSQDDYTFEFYPWVNGKCFNESSGAPIDCWKVTQLTPVTLDCTDPLPHPVGNSTVCFNVELDNETFTSEYCDRFDGNMDEDNGYCCMNEEKAPVTLYFGEESEHNLEFYCEDALGNKGPIDEEKFKVEGTAFKIPLHLKWNLISVPFVLFNDNITSVFGEVNPNVGIVWAYDGTDWFMYSPDGNSLNDNLHKMVPGRGYFVFAKKETSLLIGGSLFNPAETPPSTPMVPGWNLVGYYGTDWQDFPQVDDSELSDLFCDESEETFRSPVYCSLNSLVDTQIGFPRWSSVWGYRNCGVGDTRWVGLHTCFDESTMFAGKGYWVEIDVADLYAPATNCLWNEDLSCIGSVAEQMP